MSLSEDVQKFSPGNLVTLYALDCTEIGGDFLRFTPGIDGDNSVEWNGDTYAPIPVEVSGFETNMSGTLPSPRLKVLNVPSLQAGVIAHNGFIGAKFYRTRTFRHYLDNGDTPDPTAHFPIDIFIVDRKIAQNKIFIEWELAASIDQQGKKIPGRQIIRDFCTHIYRRYDPNTGLFDYTKATCPYSGSPCFGVNDAPVEPAQDRCGKRLSSCRIRFGQNAELPTRAFPGVAQIR